MKKESERKWERMYYNDNEMSDRITVNAVNTYNTHREYCSTIYIIISIEYGDIVINKQD